MQTHAIPALRVRPLRFPPPARAKRQGHQQSRSGEGGRAASRPDLLVRPVLLRPARLVALAMGGFLLPWSVLLAVTLPATALAQHWSLAWTGLDVAEATAALSSRSAALPRRPQGEPAAAAGGTLLLIDAWFDVCTSAPGAGRALALAEAGCVEIPLAVAAWWVAIVLSRETR